MTLSWVRHTSHTKHNFNPDHDDSDEELDLTQSSKNKQVINVKNLLLITYNFA